MHGQVRAFEMYGEVDVVTLKGKRIIKNGEIVHSFFNIHIAKTFFYKAINTTLPDDYDLIYIRYTLSDKYFIQLVSNIKGKVVIEFPTYPYETEFKGLINKLRIRIDRNWRRKLHLYVHKAIHFGPHEEIYGIPTIRMTNAIDPGQYVVSDVPFHQNRIHMIAVGKWNTWHGLDRLILGIRDYVESGKNREFPVYLDVVGEGTDLINYQNLVSKYNLQEVVTFHGLRSGNELDEIYREADVGVGSLGIHRIGLKEASPLKHREYAVRGLVMVLAGNDPDFNKLSEGVINVKSSEEPLDVGLVVKLYKGNLDKRDLARLRSKGLGWNSRVDKVMKSLQE